MICETFVELDPALSSRAHQMNPAARRFRFQTERAIRRALVQTKAAVNALVEFRKIESCDLGLVGAVNGGMGVFQW